MHSMKLFHEPYEQIKTGKKDIELRLYDEKRQLVEIGDHISFKNINMNEEILAECVELHRAETFQELFQRLNANSRMGFDEGLSPKEMSNEMRKYYSVENEQKYGVLGIEIRVL